MLGKCPECNETIRIPNGAPDAIVRCPLCSAEYDLAKVLGSLPPELEFVEGPSGDVTIEVGGEQGLDLPRAQSIPSTTKGRTYRPQKRRQINPLAEILKVVLGGLVAIPVGVLCVWWLAGRAPFGFAESVSKYAPWIVPENLRDGDEYSNRSPEEEPQKEAQPRRSIDLVPRNAAGQGDQNSKGQGVIGFEKSIADGNNDSESSQKKTDSPKGLDSKDENDKGGKAEKAKGNASSDPLQKANGGKAPTPAGDSSIKQGGNGSDPLATGDKPKTDKPKTDKQGEKSPASDPPSKVDQ